MKLQLKDVHKKLVILAFWNFTSLPISRTTFGCCRRCVKYRNHCVTCSLSHSQRGSSTCLVRSQNAHYAPLTKPAWRHQIPRSPMLFSPDPAVRIHPRHHHRSGDELDICSATHLRKLSTTTAAVFRLEGQVIRRAPATVAAEREDRTKSLPRPRG